MSEANGSASDILLDAAESCKNSCGMGEEIIAVENISKSFDTTEVIKNISGYEFTIYD